MTTWEMIRFALGREVRGEEWAILRDSLDAQIKIASAHGFQRRIIADGSSRWRLAYQLAGTLPMD